MQPDEDLISDEIFFYRPDEDLISDEIFFVQLWPLPAPRTFPALAAGHHAYPG